VDALTLVIFSTVVLNAALVVGYFSNKRATLAQVVLHVIAAVMVAAATILLIQKG
jgi:uncharacterized membrane protein